MKINHDFYTMIACPLDSLQKIGVLPLVIWFAARDVESPVSDRNANMVKAEEIIAKLNYQSDKTYPAAAMAAKSDSTIHVFQWFTSLEWATS